MKSEEIKKIVAKSENAIVESYEPDRTKVMVEFEADESELGVKTTEVEKKTSEVREKRLGSEGENLGSEDANSDFEVLMGAYRNDFRENARRVLSAIADDPEIDTAGLTQKLGISEASVWRAIRAMKEVGLLVWDGGDKGGKWIVKK
ncbi:MAG: winged helix-turn-helix domain-containing protein [Kiritimatiellae bacterium]|nr:winged helix-turn-helix domain-containing protein [Kiritimatiellia bacterium]